MATQRKSNAVSIRTVGPFDLGRLSRLHKGCFDESWSRSDLAHLLAMPGGFGLIARLFEGGLAGLAGLDAMRGVGFSLCRVVRDESELLSIGVAPSYRRRGVAGYLLRASVERARAIGARQMFLEVAIDNIGAQQLYLEHGFERVGMRPDYYQRHNGDRMSAYTMRRALDGGSDWSGPVAA
jgi:ribosomal-protein-alanine N-acetyltransferase